MDGGSGPRVSVVVPAFENEPYIRATMESILAQTYPDFELVIADHSSTDGTWEICRSSRDDPGPAASHSGGRRRRAQLEPRDRGGHGELVKLVCGDDLLAPECLAARSRPSTRPRRRGGDGGLGPGHHRRLRPAGRAEHGLGGPLGPGAGSEAIRHSVVAGRTSSESRAACCCDGRLERGRRLARPTRVPDRPGHVLPGAAARRPGARPDRWPPSGSARPNGAWPWLGNRRGRPPRCTGRSPNWRQGCSTGGT